MGKKIVVIVLELVLFLVVFFVGSLLPTLGTLPMLTIPAGADHVFVLDGLLLMLALYSLLLVVALLRRRVLFAWQNPTVALVLALVLGLLMKFGFKSIS